MRKVAPPGGLEGDATYDLTGDVAVDGQAVTAARPNREGIRKTVEGTPSRDRPGASSVRLLSPSSEVLIGVEVRQALPPNRLRHLRHIPVGVDAVVGRRQEGWPDGSLSREEMDRVLEQNFAYEAADDVDGVLSTLTDDVVHMGSATPPDRCAAKRPREPFLHASVQGHR
jgi:hypothetical protein